MKIILIFLLAYGADTSFAQVFKCELRNGKVKYQDKACSNAIKQKKVRIQNISPEIVDAAQQELQRALQKRERLQVAREEKAFKERKILALEAQARSMEKLANAEKKRVHALEKNTEAIQSDRSRNPFFYTRSYLYPLYDYRYIRPVNPYKHPSKKTGLMISPSYGFPIHNPALRQRIQPGYNVSIQTGRSSKIKLSVFSSNHPFSVHPH